LQSQRGKRKRLIVLFALTWLISLRLVDFAWMSTRFVARRTGGQVFEQFAATT
jgi:hypothetical protein